MGLKIRFYYKMERIERKINHQDWNYNKNSISYDHRWNYTFQGPRRDSSTPPQVSQLQFPTDTNLTNYNYFIIHKCYVFH